MAYSLPNASQRLTRHSRRLLYRSVGVSAVWVGLHLLGFWAPFDRIGFELIAGYLAPPNRAEAPVLVALDEATTRRWGSPPWSAERWDDLASALHAIGVQTAYHVGIPAQTIALNERIASSKPPATDATRRTRILVPSFLSEPRDADISLTVHSLAEAVGPLAPWPGYQVHLPVDPHGVTTALSAEVMGGNLYGQSAFCEWGLKCPVGEHARLPLAVFGQSGGLPSVSAADLLTGRAAFDQTDITRRVVLVGLTDPTYAHRVRVGTRAELLSVAEAVGISIANLHQRKPFWHPNQAQELILFAVLVALALLIDGLTPTRFRIHALALTPITALAITSLLYVGSVAALSPSLVLGASLIPSLVTSLSTQTIVSDFVDTVVRVILREGFRHSPRAALIRSVEDLVIKLGGLTRSYARTEDCAFLQAQPDGRLEFAGGYGIDPAQIVPKLHLSVPPFRDAVRENMGQRIEGFFQDANKDAYLIPIRSETALVGIWCIPIQRGEASPHPVLIDHLTNWLSPRLALTRAEELRRPTGLMSQIEHDLNTVRELLSAASEERRQQLETIRSLAAPVLVADVSGAVLYVNIALRELLLKSQVGVVVSLRQLLYKLRSERDLADLSLRLFTRQETLALPWVDADGTSYHVILSPVASEGRDGARELVGFVALFQDISLSQELKKIRSTVVEYASNSVRGKLMVINGYASLAQHVVTDGGLQKSLGKIVDEVSAIGEMMTRLSDLVTTEEQLDQPLPTNFNHILEGCVRRAADLAQQRAIRVVTALPDIPHPVLLVPSRVTQHLTDMLHAIYATTPAGGEVRIAIREETNLSKISLQWPGTGIDEQRQREINDAPMEHTDPSSPAPHVFETARETFGDLRISGLPGEMSVAEFSLQWA